MTEAFRTLGQVGGGPGLAGALGEVIIAVVAGAGVVGYFVAGPEHRLKGSLVGMATGAGAIWLWSAVNQAQSQTIVGSYVQPQSTLMTGGNYGLSTPSGADPTSLATQAGFVNIANLNGHIMGTWNGPNNAPVPAGLIASQ